MRESAIQQATIEHWQAFGLPDTLVAAIPNQKAFGQPGLYRGLFDLLVIGGRVIIGLIELKTEEGVLRPDQKHFRSLLIANGISHAITYGRDEPIRVLEEWGVVRKQVRAAV
jgi:VRR-NUC domain.